MEFSNPASRRPSQYYNQPQPQPQPQSNSQSQSQSQSHSHSHSHSYPHSYPHSQSQPQLQLQQQEPETNFNIGLVSPFFPRSYQSQPIYSTPSSPSLSTSSSFTFQQPYTQPLNPYNVSNNTNSLSEYSPNISEYPSSQPSSLQPLMPSGQSNGNFISNVQATTTPSRPYHQRESSLSTLGSPGAPASPFAPSTSNPLVVGDSYHEFQDYPHTYQKSLTPTHTPLQANSRWPGTPTYTQNQNNLTSTMSNINETQRLMSGNNELMAAPEFHSPRSNRPSLTTVASNDSPATPTSHEDERQQCGMDCTVNSWLNEYLHLSNIKAQGSLSRQMPKLTRTTTDAYDDELYLGYPTVSTPSPAHASTRTSSAPANDIFAQRLQAANHQHLTSNKKKSSALSPREQSPFQPGSPLAPSTASFNPQSTFGSATRMRQEQKAKDAWAIQEQYERANSEQVTPKTISPKDVDLVYHEEDDANIQSFPPLPQHGQLPMAYRSQSIIPHEPSESEDMSLSQQSYGSMATTRRESSSAYSTSSQSTSRQSQMAFNTSQTPTVPQHYPFVPSTQRQTSNMSNVSNMSDMSDMSHDFPATMTSMESGNGEYSPEQEIQRPSKTSANSGTYTCTYHGCTLRFDTPTKLQQHKKEGHRNSTSLINNMGGENRGGMTSMAQKLNSQSGPHQCTQTNPSTNKPCNIIFSRPYDLTRHEHTIHSMKDKLRCEYCTEDKTFSRNDALNRHMRVIHPDIKVPEKERKKKKDGY